jgi:hypothetical protein
MPLRTRPAGFIESCQPFLADRPPTGFKHDGYRLMARRDPTGIRVPAAGAV